MWQSSETSSFRSNATTAFGEKLKDARTMLIRGDDITTIDSTRCARQQRGAAGEDSGTRAGTARRSRAPARPAARTVDPRCSGGEGGEAAASRSPARRAQPKRPEPRDGDPQPGADQADPGRRDPTVPRGAGLEVGPRVGHGWKHQHEREGRRQRAEDPPSAPFPKRTVRLSHLAPPITVPPAHRRRGWRGGASRRDASYRAASG